MEKLSAGITCRDTLKVCHGKKEREQVMRELFDSQQIETFSCDTHT